jgi:hypothetical protein
VPPTTVGSNETILYNVFQKTPQTP